MEANIYNPEFVIISREGLDDFKEYIMPHVYEQLFRSSDFEEDSVVAVGALIDGMPAGTVIAVESPEDEFFIHSIMVADNYQRKGIGASLIKALIQIGSDTFEPKWGKNLSDVRVCLHTEYILPNEMSKTLEAFLKSVGFTDFETTADTYILDLKKIGDFGKKTIEAHSFDSIEDFSEDIENMFLSYGVEPIMELSFFSGNEENPDYLMLVTINDDNLYTLSSVKVNESATLEDYESLASLVIQNVLDENPRSYMIVPEDRNLYSDFWLSLARESGTVIHKREAVFYALIEGGEM